MSYFDLVTDFGVRWRSYCLGSNLKLIDKRQIVKRLGLGLGLGLGTGDGDGNPEWEMAEGRSSALTKMCL